MIRYLIGYIVTVNIISFLLMYLDKKRAKEGEWRIKEKALFITAFLLGEFGIMLGMKAFKHKRKKKSFMLTIITILVLHISIILAIVVNM
ncbi:MAG: DUF1294 domain-containing protein [Alkaliphilus sp.]